MPSAKTKVAKKLKPLVSIIMGSSTDEPHLRDAARVLKDFGVPFEMKIVSAHRTPEAMVDYAKSATRHGLRIIIAGAGGAAHLPGMVASLTTLPVIGVPVPVGTLGGQDALYSIVQMPKGVPVATVAIGNSENAALLAIRILAYGGSEPNTDLGEKLESFRLELQRKVAGQNKNL